MKDLSNIVEDEAYLDHSYDDFYHIKWRHKRIHHLKGFEKAEKFKDGFNHALFLKALEEKGWLNEYLTFGKIE